MSKHTPGPWRVVNATDVFTKLGATSAEGTEAAHNDAWLIADCASIPTINKNGEQCELSFREAHANARLIAAAPELLEALRALAEYNAEMSGGVSLLDRDDLWEKAAAAIDKATGDQP